MIRIARTIALLIALVAFAGLAQAQGTMRQCSAMVNGHLMMYAGQACAIDAGGPTAPNTSPPNNVNPGTLATGLAIANGGQGISLYSGYAGSPYSEFKMGFDGSGNALLTIDRVGGGTPPDCNINFNGTLYPCVTIGGGNIVGPPSSTDGDLPSFNGATGKALKDSGLPISRVGVMVPSNAILATTATTGVYAQGVYRLGYAANDGTPPLAFRPQTGSCAANSMVNDGGSCTDSSDGNSWHAIYNTQKIDIRQFGAVADNATAADAAMAAANIYSAGIGACTYVPAIYPGFKFTAAITLSNSGTNCLEGDRTKSWPAATNTAPFGKFVDLHFPNDTDGVIVNANNGWVVRDLAIQGNAATSAVATHTRGLYLKNTQEGTAENIFIQNFVTCQYHEASSNRNKISNLNCDQQQFYPNVVNDGPFACIALEAGSGGAVAAYQDQSAQCRAAAGGNDAGYSGNNATTWFQICPPGATQSSPTTGVQLTCSGAPTYHVPLWRADGIKVRQGANVSPLPNGQSLVNAPLKKCGVDYTVWDVSASGGGGAGGTQLYCKVITATLTAGSTTVAVSDTTGIPTGTDILVTADHGLQLATKITAINDSQHFAISHPAIYSGSVTVTIAKEAVATAGSPTWSQACQATNSCGYKIEIRFGAAPSNSDGVYLQWSDPTGYAAVAADKVSDYVYLRPLLVGGWEFGLVHTGESDGGIEFRPTYIELLNQCVSIESSDLGGGATAPFGDVVEIHRIINDLIPNCPGYVSPIAGPTKVTYNNQTTLYNGADNGGWSTIQTVDIVGNPSSLTFPVLGPPIAPPLNGPFSNLELQCDGVTVSQAAKIFVLFGEGTPPIYQSNNYGYSGGKFSQGPTATAIYAGSDTGLSLTGTDTVPDTTTFISTRMSFGRFATTGIYHQMVGSTSTDNGTLHVQYTLSGAYHGDTNAVTALELIPSAGTFGTTGRCSLRGAF